MSSAMERQVADLARATARTEPVLNLVRAERKRQEQLKAAGRFAHTCADPEPARSTKLAILLEEIGEVAHIVNDARAEPPWSTVKQDQLKQWLRDELVQVAAVAVAWIEALS